MIINISLFIYIYIYIKRVDLAILPNKKKWLSVLMGQNKNCSCHRSFKHSHFYYESVVKTEKYCGCNTSFFSIPLFVVVVSSSMIFYFDL